MNEIKKLTFADRIKNARKAFIGRKVGTLQFGIDIKRCDKCEYRQNNVRDNLLVNSGVRAAYMDLQGCIGLESGIEAQADLALFISKVVDRYLSSEIDLTFDEYIEKALLTQYGYKTKKD